MSRNRNKCLICLNHVKPKLKTAARHSFQDQMVLIFLLRKLAWTPISDDTLAEYLQTGNPSNWAALCHICEKQVTRALDMHRQIMKLIHRISDIRQSLYADSFYESDDESEDDNAEDGDETDSIFFKLRKHLASDYRLKRWEGTSVKRSILLKYIAKDVTIQADDDRDQYESLSAVISQDNVKHERVSDVEDNHSDSLAQEEEDMYFDHSNSSHTEGSQDVKHTENHWKDADELGSGEDNNEFEDTTATDPTWRNTSKASSEKRRYKDHVKLDQIPDDIPRGTKECPRCGNKFANGSSMRRHYRESHISLKKHQCPCCEQEFARKAYLDCHIQHNHPDRITDVVKAENMEATQCPHCSKQFQIDTALKRHIRIVHHGTNKMENCNICKENYKRKDSCTTSERKKPAKTATSTPRKVNLTKDDVADRTCNICSKVFRYAHGMRTHIRESHEKIKEHECDLCPKVFARKSYLFRHILTEHSTEPSDPIPCKICSKVFKNEFSISRHMQSVHKQRQNSTCKICSRSYSQIAALNMHVRFAHGETGENKTNQDGDVEGKPISQ